MSWDEVASVAAPVPGVYATKLTLLTGKVVVLDDVAAAESKAVAAVGRKQVAAAPRGLGPVRTAGPVSTHPGTSTAR